jgi:hypothetical protein
MASYVLRLRALAALRFPDALRLRAGLLTDFLAAALAAARDVLVFLSAEGCRFPVVAFFFPEVFFELWARPFPREDTTAPVIPPRTVPTTGTPSAVPATAPATAPPNALFATAPDVLALSFFMTFTVRVFPECREAFRLPTPSADPLHPPHQDEDQNNDQNQPQPARRVRSPTGAVRPTWQRGD